jgi:hypothetical protein
MIFALMTTNTTIYKQQLNKLIAITDDTDSLSELPTTAWMQEVERSWMTTTLSLSIYGFIYGFITYDHTPSSVLP